MDHCKIPKRKKIEFLKVTLDAQKAIRFINSDEGNSN